MSNSGIGTSCGCGLLFEELEKEKKFLDECKRKFRIRSDIGIKLLSKFLHKLYKERINKEDKKETPLYLQFSRILESIKDD